MPTHEDSAAGREAPPLTQLLNEMQHGDKGAAEQAVELVYGELHKIAARHLRHEKPGRTLVTTALIHEAYLRLAGGQGFEIQNRGHFFALASRQMRRILVDHARGKLAGRRGGGAIQVGLDQAQVAGSAPQSIDLLMLDEALRELENADPRAAKVVELRYFGGYTDKEVVEALGVSLATVRRDWDFACAWLFDKMEGAVSRQKS